MNTHTRTNTRTHTNTSMHTPILNINTIFALHAGSLSLTPAPPCMQITAGIIHTCSHRHTQTHAHKHTRTNYQQEHTCLLPHTYTHCNTNTSPSLLSLPPPIHPCLADHFFLPPSCSGTSFFFPFLSHFVSQTHSNTLQLSLNQHRSMPSSDERERKRASAGGGERVTLFGD